MSKYQLRQQALKVLERIGDNGGFSHLVLDQALSQSDWSSKDEALLTELVYGTLQRKLTLNYYTQYFVKKANKLENWVKWLLYLSFYQMKFLDKVPDHAILHQAVEIAKRRGHSGVAKLVNGVLRSAQRQGFPDLTDITDSIEQIAIETSHPRWLVERWADCYGVEKTVSICQANLQQKPLSIRVNPLKMTREKLQDILLEEGFVLKASPFSKQGLVVEQGNVLKHPLFKEGVFTVQDQSSMLVAEMMDLAEGQIVLDACSAPGGKATHIAEVLHNTGHVYAYDLHNKKAKLVSQKAQQLGLINIRAKGKDARLLADEHKSNSFDRILLDVPCSGLGVIRGKPDIKYTKTADDVQSLALIQYEILDKVSPLLKKDGKLLYSTCTVDPTENEIIINEFLSSHQAFEVDPDFFTELPEFLRESSGVTPYGLQIFPDDFQSDGFFLTRLRYKKE
ncbi:16S rRNA (cytosine(967)-C(5))-methyltransferase RsmB [Amphibacillus sediminis]|uniref:16S rRNA (cytosine(967)-C(5))-methyltransferase RsmB n=1 Tax=Amphibacillus sediminis TaxID=360185 RepID=UPI00083192F2|nr:16S rRNA (cytosine(967)-C(5))-methyltransferase RsmB [Amphibacillus sediminis]